MLIEYGPESASCGVRRSYVSAPIGKLFTVSHFDSYLETLK